MSARLTPGFASLVSDELQPKGVISLRFCVASPGAGKRPTLDCHEVPWDQQIHDAVDVSDPPVQNLLMILELLQMGLFDLYLILFEI